MIIALCGFANSGKSTIAKYLAANYGFVRASFAAPVKDVAAATFDWDRDRLEGITPEDRAWRELPDPFWSGVKGEAFTPRQALQMIGNGMRELFHKDLWVHSAISFIAKRPGINIVVDDMRYCNERNALESIGATTFIVKTPGFASQEHQRVWDLGFNGQGIPGSALHPSEWDWLRHHSVSELTTPVIVNNGSVESLYKTIDSVYTTLLNAANNK